MFKRISIFLIVLLTVLCFVSGASATALTIVKPADNSYIEYLSGAVSILKIGPTSVVTTNWTTTNTYSSMAVTDSTDATSLTTGSITTLGGASIAGQLWLGDDIDMTTNATTTYDITLKDGVADALSITREATADIIVFDTSTPRVTITPVVTITGLITATGGITVGTSGVGETVTFYGDNAGSDFVWAEAGDTNGSLTLGASTDGCDFRVYGTTATTYLHWDNDVDDLLLVGEATQLAVAGTATSGSTTTGSLRTAGGLGVVENANIGGTVGIAGAVTIGGAVGITGNITLVSTSKLYFLDTGLYIYSSENGVLDIVSDATIALAGAVTIDGGGVVGLDFSGTFTGHVVQIGDSTTALTTVTSELWGLGVYLAFSKADGGVRQGIHIDVYHVPASTGYGGITGISANVGLTTGKTWSGSTAAYIVGVEGVLILASGATVNCTSASIFAAVIGTVTGSATWTAGANTVIAAGFFQNQNTTDMSAAYVHTLVAMCNNSLTTPLTSIMYINPGNAGTDYFIEFEQLVGGMFSSAAHGTTGGGKLKLYDKTQSKTYYINLFTD